MATTTTTIRVSPATHGAIHPFFFKLDYLTSFLDRTTIYMPIIDSVASLPILREWALKGEGQPTDEDGDTIV